MNSVAGPVAGTLGASSTAIARRSIVLHALPLTLVLALLLVFIEDLSNLSLAIVSNIATICVISTLVLVARVFPQKGWSAPSVYLLVFSIFHFGVTAVFGVGLPIDDRTADYLYRWFYTSFTREAIVLSTIGLVACGLGAQTTLLGSRRLGQSAAVGEHRNQWVPLLGFLLVLVSAGGWFVSMFIGGGLALAGGSYLEFMEATADLPLPYIYYGIGLGVSFLAATSRSRLQRAGFIIFGIWALVALPLGLRGEVMFPLLAALVVAAKRGRRLSLRHAFLLVLLVLSLIAFIKQLRQVGLQEFEWSESRLSPIEALTELGGSLRPVSETIFWQHGGDQFIYGASYWAPFDRALRRILPGLDTIDAMDDQRLMNVLVQERAGPIGFSPVAEEYRNFGPLGVLSVMFILGILLGRLASWPPTQLHQAKLGIVLIALLIQVRNAFTPVPFQIALGFGILYTAVLLRNMLGKRL